MARPFSYFPVKQQILLLDDKNWTNKQESNHNMYYVVRSKIKICIISFNKHLIAS